MTLPPNNGASDRKSLHRAGVALPAAWFTTIKSTWCAESRTGIHQDGYHGSTGSTRKQTSGHSLLMRHAHATTSVRCWLTAKSIALAEDAADITAASSTIPLPKWIFMTSQATHGARSLLQRIFPHKGLPPLRLCWAMI